MRWNTKVNRAKKRICKKQENLGKDFNRDKTWKIGKNIKVHKDTKRNKKEQIYKHKLRWNTKVRKEKVNKKKIC